MLAVEDRYSGWWSVSTIRGYILKKTPRKRFTYDGWVSTQFEKYEIIQLGIRNHATRRLGGATKIHEIIFLVQTTTKAHIGKRPLNCRAFHFHMKAVVLKVAPKKTLGFGIIPHRLNNFIKISPSSQVHFFCGRMFLHKWYSFGYVFSLKNPCQWSGSRIRVSNSHSFWQIVAEELVSPKLSYSSTPTKFNIDTAPQMKPHLKGDIFSTYLPNHHVWYQCEISRVHIPVQREMAKIFNKKKTSHPSYCHLEYGNFHSSVDHQRIQNRLHLAHEARKKPSYFPLYWMVNRDPYNGLL